MPQRWGRFVAIALAGMLAGTLGACAGSSVPGEEDDAGPGDAGQPDRSPQQDAPPFFQDTAPLPDGFVADDAGGLDGSATDAVAQHDAGQSDGGGTCYPEPDESAGGDTCPDAIDKGSLTDLQSSHLAITANLWPAGDVDWYKVTFIDSPDDNDACDKFNARIAFSPTGNPGGNYAFDVFLADCATPPVCATAGDSNTGITSFEWDDSGECPCMADPNATKEGGHVCVSHSMTLTIRVYRVAGSAVCENYELWLDNGDPV
jgi:hypothetical protein